MRGRRMFRTAVYSLPVHVCSRGRRRERRIRQVVPASTPYRPRQKERMNSAASSTPNASSTRPPVCSVLDKGLYLLSHLNPANGPARQEFPPGSPPSAGAAGHPPGGKQGPRRDFFVAAQHPSTGVGPSSRVKTARWNTGEHRSRKPSSSISSRERRPAGADSRCSPPRQRRPSRPSRHGAPSWQRSGSPRLQQLQRQMAARPIPVGTEPAGGLRPPRQIAGDGGGLSALERAGQKMCITQHLLFIGAKQNAAS